MHRCGHGREGYGKDEMLIERADRLRLFELLMNCRDEVFKSPADGKLRVRTLIIISVAFQRTLCQSPDSPMRRILHYG